MSGQRNYFNNLAEIPRLFIRSNATIHTSLVHTFHTDPRSAPSGTERLASSFRQIPPTPRVSLLRHARPRCRPAEEAGPRPASPRITPHGARERAAGPAALQVSTVSPGRPPSPPPPLPPTSPCCPTVNPSPACRIRHLQVGPLQSTPSCPGAAPDPPLHLTPHPLQPPHPQHTRAAGGGARPAASCRGRCSTPPCLAAPTSPTCLAAPLHALQPTNLLTYPAVRSLNMHPSRLIDSKGRMSQHHLLLTKSSRATRSCASHTPSAPPRG